MYVHLIMNITLDCLVLIVNMGLKCNRLFLILGIVFAVYVNSTQSTYYCYYYSDPMGYGIKCINRDETKIIVGCVIGGLLSLFVFVLWIKFCMYAKICVPEKRKHVAVGPASSHIGTAANSLERQQPGDGHDLTPYWEGQVAVSPVYSVTLQLHTSSLP